jgi:hypothetical protein
MSITSAKTGASGISLALENNFMEPIASALVGSGGIVHITFDDIPQTYKHLQIRGISRDGNPSSAPAIGLIYNSDFGSSYKSHFLEAQGSAVSSFSPGQVTYGYAGYPTPGAANSSMFAATIIDILDYTNANKNKTTRILSGYDTNNTVDGYIDFVSSLWLSTDPIISITLKLQGDPFAQNTRFSLYGIKG